MTKRELLKVLKRLEVPMDATIGFRASDLGSDCPGEHFRALIETDADDVAKENQGIDFLFI